MTASSRARQALGTFSDQREVCWIVVVVHRTVIEECVLDLKKQTWFGLGCAAFVDAESVLGESGACPASDLEDVTCRIVAVDFCIGVPADMPLIAFLDYRRIGNRTAHADMRTFALLHV